MMRDTRLIKSVQLWMFALLSAMALPVVSEEYMSKQDFLQQVFAEQSYTQQVLWLDKETKQALADVLGHPYAGIRVRFAEGSGKTAWILDEIGKDLPITIGVAVENGQIEQVQILAFRESRGWEVRYPFFTEQFMGASLDQRDRLDRRIDNISGATLSVRAVKKVANMALILDNTRAEPQS